MAKLKLPIGQGASVNHTFRFSTRADDGTVTYTNFTGATIEIPIRPTYKDGDPEPDAIITFSTADGTITAPTNDGRITIDFDDFTDTTGTGNPALEDAVFTIKVTYASGAKELKPMPPNKGVIDFARRT